MRSYEVLVHDIEELEGYIQYVYDHQPEDINKVWLKRMERFLSYAKCTKVWNDRLYDLDTKEDFIKFLKQEKDFLTFNNKFDWR